MAAVGFQLFFARAPRAYSSALTGELAALSCQMGERVFALRKLYLQLAFARTGAHGEYVQNECGSVKHGQTKYFFQLIFA